MAPPVTPITRPPGQGARDFRADLWDYIQGNIPAQPPPTVSWPGGIGDTYPGSFGGGTFPTYPSTGPTSGPLSGVPASGSAGGMIGAVNNMMRAAEQASSASQMGTTPQGQFELYKAAMRNMPPDYDRFPDPTAIKPHIQQKVETNIDTALQDLLNNAQAMMQKYQQMIPNMPDPSTLPPHWIPQPTTHPTPSVPPSPGPMMSPPGMVNPYLPLGPTNVSPGAPGTQFPPPGSGMTYPPQYGPEQTYGQQY